MKKAVHLIVGEDDYSVAGKVKELVNERLAPSEQSLNLETIAGDVTSADAAVETIGRCVEAVSTAGFLGRGKVVWFKNVSFLSETNVGRSEAVKTALLRLSAILEAGVPFGNTLIISAPRADGRHSFYKTCKTVGEIHEFKIPERGFAAHKEAAGKLSQLAVHSGLKMSADIREFFLERVGLDTRQIASELEKLALFMGTRSDVTKEDVETIVANPNASLAWDLVDAFGMRDAPNALRILRQLLFQRESPIGLLTLLHSRVRELIFYRKALDCGWLARDERDGASWRRVPAEVEAVFTAAFKKDPRAVHPYRLAILAKQAERFTLPKLKDCQRLIAAAHEAIVSTTTAQPVILEMLLVRMLS